MSRKRKTGILLATLVSLLAAPVFLAVCAFGLPSVYGDTFLGELKEKVRFLEETEGPRIILTGGSGVAFGYDSSLLEKALPGYRVVNFGMYGGLGTGVMLDLSEDTLREGDLVILSPEQEEQTLSGYFNGEYFWQAADGDFSLLAETDRADWGRLAGAFPHFAAEKLRYMLQGEKPQPEGVYRRSVFNENGDIEASECSRNIMPGGYDRNTAVRYEISMVDETFVDEVNAYAKIAARKGTRVWFRFCPVNGGQWEKPEEREKLLKEQAQYYEELQELLDIPIIGDPADAVMDVEWFYDTNFHLNKSGKIVNTRQAAEDIKAMLGDSSPTEIVLPFKPSVEDTVREDGAGETKNDSADDFQWKAEDGTAVLTGLTERGREQETISVPDRIEGLPVEILPAEIFAGNRRVRRIEVSSGIRLIEDNAFAGCTSLKEIVMESADPEDCMVGQKLLEGTDADILVPEEALTDYRLNYSWSSYGSRIVKSR